MLELSVSRLVTVAFALTASASAALAGKSEYECQVFANVSFTQLQDSTAYKCGFAPGWNGTWQQNFDYCRSAKPESTDRIAHDRVVMMNMCKNVCPGYAAAAVNDIAIATAGGCLHPGAPGWMPGLTGPWGRWSGDYQAHFNWCMSGVSESALNWEREVRATEAPRCRICFDYSKTTERMALDQKKKNCGYDNFHSGDQWSTDRELHFKHCMGQPLNAVKAWTSWQTNDRHKQLQICPTPQTQAMCRRHANRAVEQRSAIDNKKTTGHCDLQGLDHSRWNANFDVHYKGCLLSPWTAAPEEQERDKKLRACNIIERLNPPLIPPRPQAQCNFGVVITLDECTNAADGTPVTNWDPKDLEPACGLGADEEQAKGNALKAYAAPGVDLIVKDEPGKGECSYSARTIPACSCDTGLSTRSYPGQKPRPFVTKEPSLPKDFILKERPALGEKQPDPQLGLKCLSGMVMTAAGRCACPGETRWNGRSCTAIDRVQATASPASLRPAPIPPRLPGTPGGGFNESRQPAVSTKAEQVPKPTVCPQDRPVGHWPNCCPANISFNGSVCMRAARKQPQQTGAGVGNSSGSPAATKADKVPRAKVCPPGRSVGIWPNCCPSGTSFLAGACVVPRPTQKPGDGSKLEPVPKPTVPPPQKPGDTSVPKSRIPVGDLLINCPPGQQRSSKGQCENEKFRAPR